ncbi:MAG: hypothetical protein H0T92_01795 [Pyrinomonadaceae bacterium]|nr:hypothetical protein [Pyrinomonadaceae bacterium]
MKSISFRVKEQRASHNIGLCLPPVLFLASMLFLASNSYAVPTAFAQEKGVPGSNKQGSAAHASYQIDIKLDFDGRSYTGTERVRWINRDTRPTSVLYFHLYANLRTEREDDSSTTSNVANVHNGINAAEAAPPNEPRLDVTAVRPAGKLQTLPFSLGERASILRVHLGEAVAAGAAAEIEIDFRGSVPEIDAEETSLLAHVVQQVDAVLRDRREVRRARDTNFISRGVMLLGTAFPVLAVRTGSDWQRKVEASVSSPVFTEVANYEVMVDAPAEVAIFTSGEARGGSSVRKFVGENLRSFAIIAGRTLRTEERTVAGTKVQSIFTAEHEAIGRRVLGVATEAVRIYAGRFGGPPLRTVSVAEAPLVANLGCAEFAGLSVIASAFYVDFDAPVMRGLPEFVREQRASVEDSLEWTVAQVLAYQWWGASVGSDPSRQPVLTESLANWSALAYYRERHGLERSQQVLEDQLRGVYQLYRTFGGEDMAADARAREYRNGFQYAAIVSGKGALMFERLRTMMGDERFFTALRRFHEANHFEIAELDDLRGAFVAEAPLAERRAITRTFNRWLSERRGDEDIAPPNPQLAAALGVQTIASAAPGPPAGKSGEERNRFSRLGRFFWRQMTRIR